VPPMTSADLCDAIEQILQDKLASDIVRLPLKTHPLIADFFIVASGGSERQLSALASHVHEHLKALGIRVSLNGVGKSPWVIADAGSVVVHLFLPETRALYALEDLWRHVPKITETTLS